jgi:hypothetical protein
LPSENGFQDLKKYLRRFVLKVYTTRIGQNIIRISRKSPSGIWNRTRSLRIWLFRDTKAPQNEALQGIADRKEHFHRILELINGPKNSEKITSIKASSQKLRIFSPDTPGDFHTISKLANYQKNLIKNNIPTRTILATEKITKEKIALFDDFLVSSRIGEPTEEIHFYHLGNNPASAILLTNILNLKPSKLIIELHDLWIYDLLNRFGELHGFPGFGDELVTDSLGAHGLLILNSIVKGKNDKYTELQRMEITSIFLSALSGIDAVYISHGTNAKLEDYLRTMRSMDLTKLELPINYVSDDEIQVKLSRSTKIIVSGSRSYSKEVKLTVLVLTTLAEMIPDLKIDLVGSICTDIEKELSELVLAKSVRRKFISHPDVSNEKWEELHKHADCGIRLGVGKNGEASGVVRDYLFFGLKVISDELTTSLSTYPQYFYFNNEVSITENVGLLKDFISSEIEMKQQDSDKFSNAYRSKLLEILGV